MLVLKFHYSAKCVGPLANAPLLACVYIVQSFDTDSWVVSHGKFLFPPRCSYSNLKVVEPHLEGHFFGFSLSRAQQLPCVQGSFCSVF